MKTLLSKYILGLKKITLFLGISILLSNSLLTAKDSGSNPAFFENGSVQDERFEVSNFSFRKGFASHGKGEYLDIYFQVDNKTDEKLKMKVFVVGFWEDNRTHTRFRKYVKYPKWRNRDYEKEVKDIVFLDSKPLIPKKDVFDFIKQNKPKTMLNQKTFKIVDSKTYKMTEVTGGEKLKYYQYPDMKDYITYIAANPTKGIEFTLFGMESKELKKDSDFIVNKNDFTFLFSSIKTSVFTKLYSKYRADRKFFNHLGIFFYDVKNKKICYRQIVRFKRKFKVY